MDRRVRLTALACQADVNGGFEDDRHLEGLTEKLRTGDTGRVREAVRATIENTMVGEDGTLTLEAKPEGLLGLDETTVPLWCRGDVPIIAQWIRSATGGVSP
jgi:hypothetical protein